MSGAFTVRQSASDARMRGKQILSERDIQCGDFYVWVVPYGKIEAGVIRMAFDGQYHGGERILKVTYLVSDHAWARGFTENRYGHEFFDAFQRGEVRIY